MKWDKNTSLAFTLVLLIVLGWKIFGGVANAGQLTHQWKSPSFHGNGYSSHVLTIENQEFSRAAEIKDEEEAAERQRIRDENSSNLSKFMKNVESRIYAKLSKQLVDGMFGETCTATAETSCEGEVNFEGTNISYEKDLTDIILTIKETDGTTTEIKVPIGDFTF